MDQNNLIAQLIPMYQKYLSDTEIVEEKAAAKLRPEGDAEAEEIEGSDELSEESFEQPEEAAETEVEADEETELETDSEPDEEPEFIN